MKNFKKIEGKKLFSLLMAVVMILQVLVITPTYAADIRIKISNIVATSDTNSIPVYGGTYKRPTFTVTAGEQAYFRDGSAGYWLKKEGEEWNPYGGTTFTEGTYKYKVQIRIDGEAGTTHVLDENGITVTVDGNTWAVNERPSVTDTDSFVWTESEEYVITKTATETAIEIPKANTNLTYNGNPQTGVNEGTGYTLTGNTATDAGTYTAKATLKAGYKWRDGSTDVKEISWSIAKARPTFTEPTGLKGQKGAKLSTVTLTKGFTWVDGEEVLNTVGENTFKAKFTPADTTNYEVIDVDLTVTVEEVVTPPEKVTLTTNVVNGHGTVTLTPNTATVDKGNTIEVTFNPDANYEIKTVILDEVDVKAQVVSNKLTITMDKNKTLTVGFKEKPVTPPPTVQSIIVISTDHKTEYKVGDPLDLTNLKIEATMSDGTKSIIPVTSGMVDGFDSSTAGTKTLTITCQDKTTTFNINVTASSTPPTPTVDSIAVNSTNHKTEYKVGEELDVTNLTIEVTKSDGSTQTVNVDKSMVKGFDSSAANPNQELTITYEGKTATYTIKIEDVTPPTKTYTVSFDGNDGGGTMPSKTVNAGDIYKLPVSTFTPPVGKEFKAWEVNGVEKTVGTDITINSNTVLKAIWKDKSVTPPTPPTPEITPNPWGPRYEYNPFWQIYFGSTQQIAPKQTTKEKTEVVITIGSKIMERITNGINDKIMMDIAPFIEENRTMLPIRFVAEALGFKVEWVNETKTVVLTNRDNVVKIPVDTNQIIVNGKVYESDVKPVLKDNRTMLPIANIARVLGLKDGTDILWDETTKKVTIIREQIID